MKKIILSFLVTLVTLTAFSVNSVTVVSPNGGENWTIGCPYAIQWLTTNATGPVKIELFKNNAFYLTICAQVPAGMSTYTWIPPAGLAPGITFKVKITCLTSAAGFDFSDGNFSINLGTISVVSPNGGEIWQKGSVHQILWTDNICENVRIELWKGGVFNSLISQSAPSNGAFTWTIPSLNTLVPGNDYKIKIISIAPVSGTTSQVFDFSDANFTIGAATLIVITPNGGENWYSGGTYLITWIDAIAENVRIELWKGGRFSSLICSSASGPFSWAIGPGIVPGNDYKVKVIGLTSSGTTGNYDFSDNNFTILQGNFITVTSPNGGELWAKGSTHIITWQDNITWNVRIELWKAGVFCSLINASTPSTGSCYWAIPATLVPGNDYKVRISALSNAGTTLLDFSDNNFSIIGLSPAPSSTPFGVVKIYPNPGSNLLHVQFRGESQVAFVIDILNLEGDVMLHQVNDAAGLNETVDLNTAGIPDGNYLVVVKKDGRIMSRDNLVLRHQ